MLAIEHYMELKDNPIKITRPRKPKRLYKDFLSESEISRMLVTANQCIRKKAIISLLAYSGIRNIELCRLKVKDVDLGDNELFITGGKNKKDRITNISSECTKVIIEYLKKYPREDSDYLFTTLRKNNQLSSADVRKHVKVIARKTGIVKRVHPHKYRHSLASNLLNRGANIILIKNQLGHSDIMTTMLYVQSMSYRQKSQYDYYKPAYS
jgi:integrase/recombinase XerD